MSGDFIAKIGSDHRQAISNRDDNSRKLICEHSPQLQRRRTEPNGFFAEILATLLFTLVILGSTGGKGATPFPGLVIGLTLVILHFPFINITGLSVNPARSLGPAMFVGGNALAQLWLFLIAPTLGGAVAGWLVKTKTLDI